ncbi:MAG: hypothetical protein HY308_05615 [Gammaproteobacteria bacterium]|nr:hypothetical protein [Gammaproteobacteria bacterium]
MKGSIQRTYWIGIIAVAAIAIGATIVVRYFAKPVPPASATDSTPLPTWAVVPHIAGTDLPPAGRSLFDVIASNNVDRQSAYDIPFPLSALLKRIENKTGCRPAAISSASSCLKAVLIPLGRSLQRTTAAPDFFTYPRVVVAVTGEPLNSDLLRPLLKDRLYLGYHEHAELIEVISYNETAGRFEFQLVKDYRAGGRPRLVYANRRICTSCHQNQAPIFSRPLWDETNANTAVAARLHEQHRDFYGIDIDRGVDIPNAIDDATDRANRYAAAQKLWSEGCDAEPTRAIRCRAALLQAALQYRLNDGRGFDADTDRWRAAAPLIRQNAALRWTYGLAIADPDIPNRDPLQRPYRDAELPAGLPLAHVAARFEPLLPRPPIAIWRPAQIDFAKQAVIELAAFLAEADVRRLRRRLNGLRIQWQALDDNPFSDATAIAQAIDQLITATENDATDALTEKPFRRLIVVPALLARLGVDYRPCCQSDLALPTAQTDDVGIDAAADIAQMSREVKRFYPYCASCHQTHERSPPNFLYGNAEQVAANIRHCAARIYFRLNMWQLAASTRPKTPMPPRTALDRLRLAPEHWSASEDFAAINNYVAQLLRADQGAVPSVEQMTLTDYETLRPCTTNETLH